MAACLALVAASCQIVGAPGAGEAIDDPVAIYLAEARANGDAYYRDTGQQLYRITRDYNNDGRPDLALAFSELCGAGSYSTGCGFEYFLKRADGHYRRLDELTYERAETAALQPLRPGAARLLHCTATREAWFFSPVVISEEGVRREPREEIAEDQIEARCPDTPIDYVSEYCVMRDYMATGRCTWVRQGD